MIKLSKRLKTIYDLVPQGNAADIGADHGKLIISLVKDNIVSYAQAVENKPGPYQRLASAIKKEGLEDKIEVLLSDGIKDVNENIDTLIIAGMGGDLIIDILNAHLERSKNIKYIIADPHTSIDKVRRYIVKLGFKIEQEEIIEDSKKYYEIIRFKKSNDEIIYNELDYIYGPILRTSKNKTFLKKHQERKNKLVSILKEDSIPNERIKEIKEELERIDEIL